MASRKPTPTEAAAAEVEEPVAIRNAAIALLARREHSALELRHKLARRGFASAAIGPVLEQLRAERLQDDARYAEIYAHSRADKGYGPLRIERELRERGIDQQTICGALAELADLWGSKLELLYRKRFATAAVNAHERAKQIRFLRHRGFTLDQINQLFRRSDL